MLVAAGAALALTGCSFGTDENVDVPDSGPVAFYPKASSGPTDKLEGTLKLTGTCLVVEQEDGTIALPVFPIQDATWDGETLTYNDEALTDGSPITLKGGVVEEAYWGPMTYLPADCERDETFFAVPLD